MSSQLLRAALIVLEDAALEGRVRTTATEDVVVLVGTNPAGMGIAVNLQLRDREAVAIVAHASDSYEVARRGEPDFGLLVEMAARVLKIAQDAGMRVSEVLACL